MLSSRIVTWIVVGALLLLALAAYGALEAGWLRCRVLDVESPTATIVFCRTRNEVDSEELAGRLASGLAHDFNNQLTVILNLVSLVQSQFERTHPAQADLDSITEAGEQAARFVGQADDLEPG